MAWEQLGEAIGTRGKDVPDVGGGVSVGESGFMQQMHTTLESENSMLPVCVGDGKGAIVEVSTPWFDDTTKARVFENAVTVRMQKPAESGICGDAAENLQGEVHRVRSERSLFTSRQMKDLCDMCRLESDQGTCGAPSQDKTAEEVCQSVGASYEEAKQACMGDFEGEWLEACAMETCVGGPAATVLAKVELQLAIEGGSQE